MSGVKIYFTSGARYQVSRRFVKDYVARLWKEKDLPPGTLSVVFVGSRKGRELARDYIKDDHAHPVLTFPLITRERHFEEKQKEMLLGEIVICYPQVTLYAAEQDKEINKVIAQFLDHAVGVLGMELKKVKIV